jgi:3-deoxy-7-phosphoheptulonate synthase
MEACGADFEALKHTEFYTGHEGLLMDYERPMTRIDSRTGTPYDTSSHFIWIGERTARPRRRARRLPVARAQPDRREARADHDARDDARARREARPAPRAGPPHVHHAHGRGQRSATALPPLLEAIKRSDANPLWVTDPMHGNGITTPNGYKTRASTTWSTRCAGFFEAHRAAGTYPGGIHVELTGDDVTECLGGSEHIDEETLATRYESAVRPAPEPHAVARAGLPRGRGAHRSLTRRRGRPCGCPCALVASWLTDAACRAHARGSPAQPKLTVTSSRA